MSCPTETITLANSFFQDSTNNYVVKNYTILDASGNSKTSCLPTSGTGNSTISSFPTSSIDTSGNVLASALSSHVSSWLQTNNALAPDILTPTNNDPVTTFATKSALLRTAIKAEYCYYQNRYMFILNEYLTNKTSTTNASTGDKQKDCVINLNSILNQILQVYQALINSRNATVASYYTNSGTNVNTLNEQVTSSRDSLQRQSTILQNANLTTDVQSAMIEYSIEKNQSSRNLLVIYGFMNLVAAGLIVYLYRSTRAQ